MTHQPPTPAAVTSAGPVYGSLPEHLEAHCRELKRRLSDLQNEYLLEAEPYARELARLESLRPLRGYVTVPELPHD